MSANVIRTVRSLTLTVALVLTGTASLAAAGGYVAEAASTARTRANASILAPEAPPQLLAAVAGSTAALDGDGRALSVSLPAKMLLHGAAPAAVIAARAALAPAGPGTARLMLSPDRPLRQVAAAGGAYVGELRMSLDYN